jgi:CheY-like chemotaxis protein
MASIGARRRRLVRRAGAARAERHPRQRLDRLPGSGGAGRAAEATRRLRQDSDLRTVPIVAVSASATQSNRDRSFAAGVDAFMHKPIDFHELLRNLAALLQLTWTYSEE